MPSEGTIMQISVRSYLTAGIALTAASTIALTPLAIPPTAHQLALPQVSAPEIHLTALINPSDVTALVNNLNAALNSVSTTVTSAVGAPGQTLDGALGSATALNTSLWDGLISATPSAPLTALLKALKASANSGLVKLADSVAGANDTVTLTTGQIAALLTSTLTGSLGTALYAVSDVVNNPLALASYTSLLDVPVGIAGTALNNGLAAINSLGGGAINLGGTLVHGVTAQISNVLALVNGAADAAKTLTGIDLINGTITAVQGIVSAPVTAALAGVDGITTTITHAATTALSRVTSGAQHVVCGSPEIVEGFLCRFGLGLGFPDLVVDGR
ncbi:hypothetical protein MycrhDRAFT_5651 [Mycolicibacterium rhodesiae JS60]|nr:hypothetical protein MycrhDRAFT_5651 [Mycolicibacterium rhodesiae JS60]